MRNLHLQYTSNRYDEREWKEIWKKTMNLNNRCLKSIVLRLKKRAKLCACLRRRRYRVRIPHLTVTMSHLGRLLCQWCTTECDKGKKEYLSLCQWLSKSMKRIARHFINNFGVTKKWRRTKNGKMKENENEMIVDANIKRNGNVFVVSFGASIDL